QDKKWIRLYKDLEKANIGTIHSFCSRILRENPVESGVDPLFSIMDEYESDELLKETISECIVKGIEKDEDIYKLVKEFNLDMLNRINETFMNIYKKIRNVGMSFDEISEMTLNNIDNFKIEEKQINFIKKNLSHLMDKARKNSKLYKLKEDPIWINFLNNHVYDETILEDLNYIEAKIGNMKGEEERIEKIKNVINNVMKIKEVKYRDNYKALIKLLIIIDEKFTAKKKRIGCLDYDDLQIYVLELLEQDHIRKRYQNKYRYIMVDEFQDTNELQKQILYKLCSKESKLDRENLFIVGDPKQSIYGFRGADVEVFFEVMEDIEEVSKTSPILLNKNYRSVSPVLEFVNNVFTKVMGERYDSLEANKKISGLRVEVVENKELQIPEGVSQGDYNKYYESRIIAKRIKELVNSGEYSYKDFALLFRSSTEDHIYEKALEEYGIPYYNIGGKGFYKQDEIVDLINGLKSISNSYDSISIVGLLRSPMFGISDKTIYWLLRRNKENLLMALEEEISSVEEKEKKKIEKAAKILYQLRVKKDIVKVDEILEELISKTYYSNSLMLQHGNKQKIANVYKFVDIAREYRKMHNGSMEEFIDYIEKLRIEAIEESQAQIETEAGNTVKIMTIHKSKGLQFKVVAIPQMSKGFVTDTSDILFHKSIGLGIRHRDCSPLYDDVRHIIGEKENEENKRILYV
ncbi:MAG TPA: UvrD-helicase domain-containing protein, partial [Tissierellales bacterium]|nr:UvrD-helicase domain-containing protein [Tissierellales bacterium]